VTLAVTHTELKQVRGLIDLKITASVEELTRAQARTLEHKAIILVTKFEFLTPFLNHLVSDFYAEE
jgi:hypothetical protein